MSHRKKVAALFDAFVTDVAVRQALQRIPWGGFRQRVLEALAPAAGSETPRSDG